MQQNPELVDQPLQGGRTKNIICEHNSVGQNELVSFFVFFFFFFFITRRCQGAKKKEREKIKRINEDCMVAHWFAEGLR